jgi:hypothetical protein
MVSATTRDDEREGYSAGVDKEGGEEHHDESVAN